MKRFIAALMTVFLLMGCGISGRTRRIDGSLPKIASVSIPPAPRKATTDEVRAYINQIFNDGYRVWSAFFATQGLTEPFVVNQIIEKDAPFSSNCSWSPVETDEPNAFYCYLDGDGKGAVIFPLETFVKLFAGDAFGSIPKVSGDFSAAVVIAHELGHSVADDMAQQLSLAYPMAPNGENLADCFAGNWAKSADSSGILRNERDFAEAVALMEAVGDNSKTHSGDNNTHGTSEQRVAALNRGFFSGKPIDCIREYWPESKL